MRRRLFTACCIALLVAASIALPCLAEPVRVRVVAANLSSGNHQSYPVDGPGARILRALDADVVLIQEWNLGTGWENDDAAVEAWVREVFGPDFEWCREPGDEQIPNGVVSRFPILECGDWDDPEVSNRDFAFAHVDLPGEPDLWAVSVHLLTKSSGARNTEAVHLATAIREKVPEADYLVVGGDLNTKSRDEPALRVLEEVIEVDEPFPDDGRVPFRGGTNSKREHPYDWVLADGDLEPFEVAVEIGELAFLRGLVFDSRIYSPEELAESFPGVRPNDSGAPGMQHMAVVREFAVPVEASPDPEPPAEPEPPTDPATPAEPDPDVPPGVGLNLSGLRLEQSDSDHSLTIPEGVVLAPGGILVIGRQATREEFEAFWGALPPEAMYLNGADVVGGDGFPQLNGGERFRLVDADGGAIDPISGEIPRSGLRKGRTYLRETTGHLALLIREDPETNATPGVFDGIRAETGSLVITEICDPAEGGNFLYEFLEIFYDITVDE